MTRKRLPHGIGFALLSAFLLLLLAVTLVNLYTHNTVFFVVFIFLTAGCLVATVDVFITDVLKGKAFTIGKEDGLNFIAVFFGGLITYALHVHTPLCNVLAAGVVGILLALFFPKHAVPGYCGAFVGMSASALFGPWFFMLAALLAAGVFVIAKGVYNGYGGKLGTIAFSGALITWAAMRSPFETRDIPFSGWEMVLIVIVSALAATLTYVISIRLKQGPVMASGLIGLIVGAMFTMMPFEGAPTLSVVAIGASFVGMSGFARFKNEIPMLAAGAVFGLVFVYSDTHFAGAGGKLGTIAFLSVLAIGGIRKWRSQVQSGKVCRN